MNASRSNTYAAWPAMRGLGRFYQLHIRCRGEADPVTGYFMNIKEIDQAVRNAALPYLNELVANGSASDAPLGSIMQKLVDLLQPPLNQTLNDITFELTPFYHLQIRVNDMQHVIVKEQFQFAAAHRLHVDALSDEKNREVFGKCNNPSGHGHNYRLEVAVRAPIDKQGDTLNVETLDRVVDETVINALDHKHLNKDVPQFADINPSVENIAKVIHEMLSPAVQSLGVKLDEVTVWETDKTMCTYRG